MAATTRWIDNSCGEIDTVIEKLIDEVPSDDKVTNISWDNWRLHKVFDQLQKILLNGKEVRYNCIRYTYDQTTVGDVSIEDRVVQRSGFIIVYTSGNNVNYIIDQNSSALKILRRLLSYTGRSEIGKNTFELPGDFFIWLIYRVYNSNYNVEIAPEDKVLTLDTIRGFRGDTEDMQTKVSASGETVMNIISTLSFLLESNNLNQIQLDLSYTDHSNISLVLQKSTIKIAVDDYSGIFEREGSDEQKNAKLYLLVYLEIMPLLFQEYNTDVGNDIWNQTVYVEFLRDLGQTLTNKITSKIKNLNNES